MFTASVFWRRPSVLKSGMFRPRPIRPSRLSAKPVAWLRAKPNRTFIAGQVWRAAALQTAGRPCLPVGFAAHGMSGSYHILTLAAGLKGQALIGGGAAIAMGLPANLGLHGVAVATRPGMAPGCVLSGSCSSATQGQVATHAARHPVLRIGPADRADPAATLVRAQAFLADHMGAHPLVTATAPPTEVAAAQAAHGREAPAARFDAFPASLATAARAQGFRSLVVAGGETSGAVMQAPGPVAYDVGTEIAPGVPTLFPADGTGGLVLKSGNFGGPDFFSQALDRLATGR
jgi:uncharacterized protein YgbK (DUF1537 family)